MEDHEEASHSKTKRKGLLTKEKGLEELRSPAAVQALVAALQPSPAKEAHVMHCLKTVYGLDRLPTEPGASGENRTFPVLIVLHRQPASCSERE